MKYSSKKFLIGLNRSLKLSSGKIIARYLRKYNYESLDKVSANDFVMAGYPKSGNTWMQNLLAGLIYGIDTKYLPDRLTQELIPDLDYKLFYKRCSANMCFKTHDFPSPLYKNVIHLIRDPRDVMASYYAMAFGRGKISDQKKMIVDGENLLFGTWADHTKLWKDNPYNANLLVIKYEDLLTDPFDQLRNIAQFMNIDRSDELIQRVISGNSLSMMKTKEKDLGFDKAFIRPENWKEGHTFVRSGQQGAGKKELDQDMISYIEKQAHEFMEFYGYSLSQ
jgi:hypothetical protein